MHPLIKTGYIILIPWAILLMAIFALNKLAENPKINVLGVTKFYSFNFIEKILLDQGLKEVVESRLNGADGDFAIYIESMVNSKQKYTRNEIEKWDSASLYKLFLLAQAYEAIEKGELKEDSEISSTIEHLDEVVGGREFGYEDYSGGINFTVAQALERIAILSDNYASVMLAEKLGWEKVQAQADKIGAQNTLVKSPIQTSAEDIGLFFKKLYLGEVVSRESSDKIIELLSKSKLNDRLPAKLPVGLKIAHKTGELARLRHDAGIVFLEGNPYVIVLMSRNLKGEDDGAELLANLSKDIYEYFSSP